MQCQLCGLDIDEDRPRFLIFLGIGDRTRQSTTALRNAPVADGRLCRDCWHEVQDDLS